MAPDEQVGTGTVPLHDFLDLGFVWETTPGVTAEVRMPIASAALGFTGSLHGGAIATMVDLACALAAARASGFDPAAESLVTADMHIRYLGRPSGDVVTARAEVARTGSQLIVVECRVTDPEGHVIAIADFSMMRVPLRRPLSGGDPTQSGAPEL